MNYLQKTKGFTIIEVVLVLAIAGLIFLMVFVALPALQSSQRDTARRNDVSIVSAAVNSFKSANRGAFPNTTQLNSFVEDTSDNTTTVQVVAATSSHNPTVGVIDVMQGRQCGTSTASTVSLTSGTNAQYVVITELENGAPFCSEV